MAYQVTALYDQESGEAPLKWGKNAVAEGEFSANAGRVMVDDVLCTPVSWTASQVVFVPVASSRPDGNYSVHFDNEPSIPAGEYLHDFTAKQIGNWTHARTSVATAPDEAGVIQTYASGEPAWYRDQGLQLEDTSTNTVKGSTNIQGSGAWVNPSLNMDVSYHSSISAPDDTLTAMHMVDSVGGGTAVIYTTDGQAAAYASSIWARSISGSGQVYLMQGRNDGVIGSYLTIDETWRRFNLQSENGFFTAVDYRHGTQGSTTLSECLVWQPQSENNSFPTSEMLTNVSSTFTRSAISCTATFAELGAPLPAGGVTNDFCGQITVRLQFPSTDANSKPIYSIGDMTNGIAIAIAGTTLTLTKYVGGSPTALSLTVPAYVTNDLADIRYRISATDMKLWLGNALSNANANGTALAAGANMTTLEPGFIVVSKVRLVPEALSDEGIEAWT